MKYRWPKLAVPLMVLALLAVACGGDDDDDNAAASGETTETTARSSTQDAATVGTAAADLRAGLTAMLQEHVYLAGLAINQAVADGGNMKAPATANAVAALDANSVALSKVLGSVYGADAEEQFLELWRKHIGFFVDYTLGGATGDDAKQDQARKALDDYRADFGAFVDSATKGNLSADATAQSLQVHVDTLITAIDAVLAKDPSVFPKLREAASHMPMTAEALSAAIVAANPDKFQS